MGIATGRTAQERKGPSLSSLRTYWRMRLDRCLREPKLLRAVEVDGAHFTFITSSWSKYWGYVPRRCKDSIHNLRAAWEAYVRNGCNPDQSAPYSDAYFDVLRALVRKGRGSERSCRRFLSKLLGFENFRLRALDDSRPFAIAAASFRNPVFLSLMHAGLRKHRRGDPALLPLAVGCWEGGAAVFYHYRKQRLLKNTDDSILFFPATDPAHRPASFCGLETLTDVLVSEWDSRVKERSRLLGDKVLVPLLRQMLKASDKEHHAPVRVLDVGSGVGLFTSRVLARLAKSGVLGHRKLEPCLLDLFPVDPKKHFARGSLMFNLAKVDYVSGDYTRDLDQGSSVRLRGFDMVFLFRILHNMSLFRVERAADTKAAEAAPSRYRFTPHLSDYYGAISRLFPRLARVEGTGACQGGRFFAVREFNPSALLTVAGHSLVERLLEISKGILIEDGDLEREILLQHIGQHVRRPVHVYDFSRALRLSVNHVYWIMAAPHNPPPKGQLIWPN